jgi:hypothetical protein
LNFKTTTCGQACPKEAKKHRVMVILRPLIFQNGSTSYRGLFLAGWVASENRSGVGLSVLQPDCSMILNLIIQWENVVIILVERELV